MELLLVKEGHALTIKPLDGSPAPRELVATLHPQLSYMHRSRPEESFYSPCGNAHRVDVCEVPLYSYDYGAILTGSGFMWRVWRYLETMGHHVYFKDASPPPKRPMAYTPDWNNCLRQAGEFRDTQLECLQSIAANPCGLIKAPPGYGKTRLMRAQALLYPWAKIHIICDIVDVARDIQRSLVEVLPNIGFIGDGDCRRGERVTVIMAQSLHNSDGDADILIGEEGHRLCTPSVSTRLATLYNNTRNYTYTATPVGRGDGADCKLEMFFGPPIFWMDYPEAVERKLIAPITVRWLDMDFPVNPALGKKGTAHTRWGVWRNEMRNRLIADDIHANYPPDHQILIMVDKVDHAAHLFKYMPEATLVYGESTKDISGYVRSGLLPAGMQPLSTKDRMVLKDRFVAGDLKRVIATDVWGTGVSLDALPSLFRADARASQIIDEQLPGRAGRIFANKEMAEVVDCCDRFDRDEEGEPGPLMAKAWTRRRHYNDIGFAEANWPIRRGGRRS